MVLASGGPHVIDYINAIAGTVGVLLAITLALFGPWLNAVRTRPKLRLEVSTSATHSMLIEGEQQSGVVVGEAMNFHWRIINDKGWSRPAKNAEVVLFGVRTHDGEKWGPLKLMAPVPFFWAPGWLGDESKIDVRGDQNVIDFCRVEKRSGGRGLSALFLCLHKGAGYHADLWIQKGKKRFWVEIRADNAPGKTQVFQAEWDGEWSREPKEMLNHVKLVEVKDDHSQS